MKLSSLIRGGKETQEDFFNRTIWIGPGIPTYHQNPHGRVFVYTNHKLDTWDRTWAMDTAVRYVNGLESKGLDAYDESEKEMN